MKNDKTMKKKRKIAIFHFFKIFAPLEAKMMKNDKKMKKKKKLENCNFSCFCTIFAPLEAKMMKNEKNEKNDKNNDKNWLKNDKQMIP